jgi:hypothetical protein
MLGWGIVNPLMPLLPNKVTRFDAGGAELGDTRDTCVRGRIGSESSDLSSG